MGLPTANGLSVWQLDIGSFCATSGGAQYDIERMLNTGAWNSLGSHRSIQSISPAFPNSASPPQGRGYLDRDATAAAPDAAQTRTAAIQELLEHESRICGLERAAVSIVVGIRACTDLGEAATSAASGLLSTLEPLHVYHVSFFNGLLACMSLEAFSAYFASNITLLSPVYERFLEEFDRSLAVAGPLLAAARVSEEERWIVVDAFVDPVCHIETYRSILKILLDVTPSSHAARENLTHAAKLMYTEPVQVEFVRKK